MERNVEKENEITRKGKFQLVTFLFLLYVIICVSASDRRVRAR